MVYRANVGESDIESVWNDAGTVVIDHTMLYEDVCAAVKACKGSIADGRSLIRAKTAVTRCTCVPTSAGDGFALVFSISHTVADGATYYAILNQVSSPG